MYRNIYTGDCTFTNEEMEVVTLGIDARCEQTLSLYRSCVSECPPKVYFAKEYLKAAAIYKQLMGTDYPATTDEGDVPTTTDSNVPTSKDDATCSTDSCAVPEGVPEL